ERRGAEASGRKSPPFAGKREGWGTLKFKVLDGARVTVPQVVEKKDWAKSMKKLSILGSTGSIGRQTLAVVESLPGRFEIVALAAGRNLDELMGQIERHRPEVVSVGAAELVDELARRLRERGIAPLPEILHGRAGMLMVGTHGQADMVVSAAVGVVGLEATYEAIKRGKVIALSNKEVLVAAGELVMAAVETPGQALQHPNWKMGHRITIDSATMMNKGFEVIEAHWLFGVRPDQIEVVVHPQSTIHSMVEFVDGSVLAQMAPPDMRMPIQYALTYPDRVASNQVALDWKKLKRLDFEKASTRRFPCLRLAREALKKGGAWPCALNAADEVAVAAYLEKRLGFLGIPEVIERVLSRTPRVKFESMEDVLAADAEARRVAVEEVTRVSWQQEAEKLK